MSVTLVRGHKSLQVPSRLLIQKSDLFAADPLLAVSPYVLKSEVSRADFQTFVSALEGKPVQITNHNFNGLSQLCDEFNFRELMEQLSAFRASPDFAQNMIIEDLEARNRLSGLEEHVRERDREIALLRQQISRQSLVQESTETRLRAEVESANRRVTATQEAVDELRNEITTLRNDVGEVRELTNSLKTSALASQKVSESAVKKVESTDSLLKKLKDSFHSLFGRVTRLEAEVLPPKPTTVVYEKPKPPGTPNSGYVVDPDDRVRVPDSPVIRIYTGPSFLARHKVTGALSWVATFTQGFSDRFFEQILFATLVHPTLLGTIGFSLPGGTREATIVTEYMPHGSLDTLIKDTARYAALSPTAKAKIAVGIVLGMRYLHACDVIHRDLKPSHILLDENYEPRILTKRIANDFEPSSYFYIAPEVFNSETAHGKAVDAFSFGMILWEIITGKPVMTGYKVRKDPGCVAHLKRVSQCVRPTTDGMEPLTNTLLEATWGTDPSDRANFSEILDLLKQDHYEIIPGIDDGEVARYVKGIEDYEAAHPPIPLAVEDEEE